jgi:multiple sugar transport system substrate-binding protein
VDAMIKYCGIGWSPAKDYIGAQREQPSAWFSGQNYNEDVFAPAAKEQNIDWSWSPVTQSAFTSLQNQFRRKITGGLKLSDAVELAQREIVQSFKDKGLSVRTAS